VFFRGRQLQSRQLWGGYLQVWLDIKKQADLLRLLLPTRPPARRVISVLPAKSLCSHLPLADRPI
jgi:hypothetical protein